MSVDSSPVSMSNLGPKVKDVLGRRKPCGVEEIAHSNAPDAGSSSGCSVKLNRIAQNGEQGIVEAARRPERGNQ